MNFDFSTRYQTAFGFSPGQLVNLGIEAGFDRQIKARHDTTFEAQTYSFDKNPALEDLTLTADGIGEFYFAYREFGEQYSEVFATPPMLSFRREKRLVITPLDNTDVEVIERYSTSPYIITMCGLLIDMEEHVFPKDKLEDLNNFFEANTIWKASSEILEAINVFALVIQDIDLSFVEGFEDTVSYQITARASKTLEYQLIQN